jgi:hypothetical protein
MRLINQLSNVFTYKSLEISVQSPRELRNTIPEADWLEQLLLDDAGVLGGRQTCHFWYQLIWQHRLEVLVDLTEADVVKLLCDIMSSK